MNWTGGRLHQSKREKSGFTAQQRSYFTKTRNRLLKGYQNETAIDFRLFQKPNQEKRNPKVQNSPACMTRNFSLTRHNMFNTVPTKLRQHDSTSSAISFSENYNDSEKQQPIQQTRLQSVKDPRNEESYELETKRLKLLQRTNWLNPLDVEPLKLKPQKYGRNLIARRRRLDEDDIARIGTTIKPNHRNKVGPVSPTRLNALRQSQISIRHGSKIHTTQQIQAHPYRQNNQPRQSQAEEMLLDSSQNSTAHNGFGHVSGALHSPAPSVNLGVISQWLVSDNHKKHTGPSNIETLDGHLPPQSKHSNIATIATTTAVSSSRDVDDEAHDIKGLSYTPLEVQPTLNKYRRDIESTHSESNELYSPFFKTRQTISNVNDEAIDEAIENTTQHQQVRSSRSNSSSKTHIQPFPIAQVMENSSTTHVYKSDVVACHEYSGEECGDLQARDSESGTVSSTNSTTGSNKTPEQNNFLTFVYPDVFNAPLEEVNPSKTHEIRDEKVCEFDFTNCI
jgi:hypothetical protein